nr:hypothetical protein Itr_chr15CG10020 [Ipomoea trifida]GMD96764.1 hypothetical protein Iba_chr15bCG7920 [Ipomoea batatas]GME01551.1 hypothetical protein Iba_contig2074CG0010 [Ipomoea batatas]
MAYGWRRMKRKRRLDFSLKMRWRVEPATSNAAATNVDVRWSWVLFRRN